MAVARVNLLSTAEAVARWNRPLTYLWIDLNTSRFSNAAAAYPTPCDPRCGEGDAFRHLQMGGFVALAPTGAHAARAMLVNPRPGPAPLAETLAGKRSTWIQLYTP